MRIAREPKTRQRRIALLSPCVLASLMPCLLLFSLFGTWFTKEPTPEELLLQGRRAAADGDYERAVALYERAEVRSIDPAEVAFYLAAAKYHLAAKTESYSAELLEAELLYRCCLDSNNPHRPRALCGLGACLLRKADGHDEGSLRGAFAAFDLCLLEAGDDAELIDRARFNREKAHILLLQFQPPPSDSSSESDEGDQFNPRPQHSDPRQAATALQPVHEPGSEGSTEAQPAGGDTKSEAGADSSKNNEPTQPGKGNLPPIPDEVDVPPLPERVAEEYLEKAAKKVFQERQTYHRRSQETTVKGVKDW
jgi:hypothetical protein